MADGVGIVAQSSDGQRWIFDAESGRTLVTGPAPKEAWPSPPLALDARRLLVVEDGRLVALDRSSWKRVWSWDLPRAISLTGELPRTRLVNGMLIVGVPRNDCYEIERLDPVTGRPLSGDAVAIARGPADLAAIAVEGNRLYVAAEGKLTSFDLRTGGVTTLRSQLPGGCWRIESAANGLIAWQAPTASPSEPPSRSGFLTIADPAALERQRGNQNSSALEIGRAESLRSVRVSGNCVIVATESEIRGYRGANREVK